MKTAIIYGCHAVVDSRIRHIEFERQVQIMEAFCHARRLSIAIGFADKTSGSLARTGIQQLLKEVITRKATLHCIVVTYWRHLTSDPREMMQLIDALYSLGVQVISTHDPDDTWFESVIYKFKNCDVEAAQALRAKGTFVVPAFDTKLEELIE